MPGRLAIDFGTSNTVLSLWDETRGEAVPYHIPDYGRLLAQEGEQISVIPSLIHYGANKTRWIGNQVLAHNLYQSERTFRWMKRYISSRSPIRIRIDGRDTTPSDAGKDFLSTILLVASQELGIGEEEVAFSIPVEAYEHYEDWLSQTAEEAGMPRFRLIDEASAAALGYGAHIQPGSVYLILDFGGGTLHVAVILIEDEESTATGRRCRVLGKAGVDIGGASIDQWLFEETLRRNQRTDMDDDIRPISNSLLVECERVKEALSFKDQAELSLMNPHTGSLLTASFTRQEFEDLLDKHDVYAEINRTIRAALNSARERGFSEDDIQAALVVGGSSQIPSVKRTVRQIFGNDHVFAHHPLDAVARGAAAFVAGVDFFDHIQHDYAIRYRDAANGDYDYRVIVPRGTPYPTSSPVAKLAIKATYPGQAQLGIAIFEIGVQKTRPNVQPFELVFDPSGAARIMKVTPDEAERRTLFWMNEQTPTFLKADPPAGEGEPRFEVEFNIDENKRLLITARDIKTNRLTHRDFPVVKLS
ncbi:MAG TPA: Hsp70 family protein [Anaerolineaceae bacterium]|nr:Hsp70 family protein [Anaerolineaceae bacterium]